MTRPEVPPRAGCRPGTPSGAPGGRPCGHGRVARLPTVRWALTHMIQETGRSAGHAGILRELINGTSARRHDGTTGRRPSRPGPRRSQDGAGAEEVVQGGAVLLVEPLGLDEDPPGPMEPASDTGQDRLSSPVGEAQELRRALGREQPPTGVPRGAHLRTPRKTQGQRQHVLGHVPLALLAWKDGEPDDVGGRVPEHHVAARAQRLPGAACHPPPAPRAVQKSQEEQLRHEHRPGQLKPRHVSGRRDGSGAEPRQEQQQDGRHEQVRLGEPPQQSQVVPSLALGRDRRGMPGGRVREHGPAQDLPVFRGQGPPWPAAPGEVVVQAGAPHQAGGYQRHHPDEGGDQDVVGYPGLQVRRAVEVAAPGTPEHDVAVDHPFRPGRGVGVRAADRPLPAEARIGHLPSGGAGAGVLVDHQVGGGPRSPRVGVRTEFTCPRPVGDPGHHQPEDRRHRVDPPADPHPIPRPSRSRAAPQPAASGGSFISPG
ncbi:DUF664 domain-containing protein [Streptomyces sp. IF17]|nr:DUF664 domain-containing protein [Streptomyces alkaliphilus]